jgi:hypothetical protein
MPKMDGFQFVRILQGTRSGDGFPSWSSRRRISMRWIAVASARR